MRVLDCLVDSFLGRATSPVLTTNRRYILMTTYQVYPPSPGSIFPWILLHALKCWVFHGLTFTFCCTSEGGSLLVCQSLGCTLCSFLFCCYCRWWDCCFPTQPLVRWFFGRWVLWKGDAVSNRFLYKSGNTSVTKVGGMCVRMVVHVSFHVL